VPHQLDLKGLIPAIAVPFNDDFSINFRAGRSLSKWEGPMRLQTFIDAIDVDNVSIDFRGGRETPLISFGSFDVSNPNSFQYGPPLADATVLGGFSTQGKPSENITDINTFELSGDWQLSEKFGMKLGTQYRDNEFNAHVSNLATANSAVTNLPAGVTLADITRQITGLDDKFGSGAPSSWVAVDSKKWRDAFNYPDAYDFCNVECGANKNGITEKVKTAYLVLNFNSGEDWAVPIRGHHGSGPPSPRSATFPCPRRWARPIRTSASCSRSTRTTTTRCRR